MQSQQPTPAQRLQRSMGINPYSYESEAPTAEFAPVSIPNTHHLPPGEVLHVDQPVVTILVTAVHTATIFEGVDNIYRYDLPLSGITDGWAVGPIIDQVRTMAADQWPHIRVAIDAPGNAGTLLLGAFRNAGMAADFADEIYEATYGDDSRPEPAVYGTSDSQVNGRKVEHLFAWFHPFHLAIVVVVLAVCGVSWWAIGKSADPLMEQPQPLGAGTEATPLIEVPRSAVPVEEEDLPDAVEELVPIIHGNTRIELPPGYEVTKEVDSGLITLTGNDQDFRILMAANAMEEEKLSLANIAGRVASSSTLAARTGQSVVGGREVVSYMENPEDGSTAHWYVWGEAGHQLSVGCHWRGAVTPERQPDCETAVKTLSLLSGQ